MEQIEQLKEMFAPVLDSCNVKLYELKWNGSGKNRTLEVAIMKEDGTMDLDTCALVSEKLSEVLDGCTSLNDAYTLEVCSPGAEREIYDLNELVSMHEPYVYIRFKHSIEKMIDITGTILAMEDGMIEMSYRNKQAVKKVKFSQDEIDFIRLAVKF